MKKNVLNTLGAIGIMALIALNVYVVTSKETPAFLKWDAMSYIFAKGNSESGSGSGSESGFQCSNETYIPNETLRPKNCLLLWNTYLKCVRENNVCCDPSKQTTCNGSLPL